MSTGTGVRPKIAPRPKNGPTRFVARQPIFDRAEGVFAYELLFRDGVKEFSQFTDADLAARQTMDSSLLMGLEVLCSGRRAFVNCTAETLTGAIVFVPSALILARSSSKEFINLLKSALIRRRQRKESGPESTAAPQD